MSDKQQPPRRTELYHASNGKNRWRRFVAQSRQIIDYRAYERIIIRALFALLIWDSIRWNVRFTEQPRPNGLASWIDLTFLSNPQVLSILEPLTICGLAIYVIGFLPAVMLIPAMLSAIGIGTLINSQGAIGHSTQLITMMIMAQWLVYAIQPYLRNKKSYLRPDDQLQNLSIHWAKIIIAASYTASGIMKLKNSDGMWIADVPYLSIQFIKTNQSEFYNSLEQIKDYTTQIPDLILANPNLARLIFGAGLFAELLCFVAMLGRRWAFAMGAILITLHLTVSVAMNLDFDNHVAALAIFFINLPGIPYLFKPSKSHLAEN